MAEWYVKDLSKSTGVSVQTLHHYDRIGLLKPSLRLQNGYRIYSEKDLLRLQQIIALKFFGFELSQIKKLLTDHTNALEDFSVQSKLLEQKANRLLEASQTLKQVISDVADIKSIPWETIIKLIEVYHMSQKLEHNWVKEIYTQDELKEYAAFETELKANKTPEEKTKFENSWADLRDEFKKNLDKNPESPIGITLGGKLMSWVNGVYGKKYAHLRTIKFEKGFAQGKGLEEVGLTPEIVAWMDKAMDAYWRDRIYNILDKVNSDCSEATLLNLWNELLDDMYGDDHERRKEIYDIALADEKVEKKAKEWLKKIRSL